MIKKMYKLCFVLACCLICLMGCASKGSRPENTGRFMVLDAPHGLLYVDKETKVQYLFVTTGYGTASTLLVDADGKPVLYNGSIN